MRRSTILLVCSLLSSASTLACGSSSSTNTDDGGDAAVLGPDAGAGDASAEGDAGAAAWQETKFGNANIVPAVAVDPKNASVVFIGIAAGSAERGFFRTKDGGKTWTKIAGDPKLDRYAGFVVIHPQNGTILLNPGVEGIWRSVDGGDTFAQAATDPGGTNGLFFHPTANVAWTVTSQAGVFRSNDGGATWARTPNTGLPLNKFGLGPLAFDGNKLYLGTGGAGVYVSTDDGDSWTKAAGANLPEGTVTANALNLIATPSRPGVLFLQTNGVGLFRSTDGAASFVKVEPGGGMGTRYPALRFDPTNPQTIYVSADETQGGPGGLLKSADDGQSWNAFGPATVPIDALDVASDGSLFAGTIGKGVWRFGN
jgi:photosystem II stability/assembly factor-like uncharacterized protein